MPPPDQLFRVAFVFHLSIVSTSQNFTKSVFFSKLHSIPYSAIRMACIGADMFYARPTFVYCAITRTINLAGGSLDQSRHESDMPT